jgi:putative ABC transport system permease protein
MFQNYIKIALRTLVKNRVFAFINVFGLAIGLTVYLFGGIIADYEREHDIMFTNHERTYTIASNLSPKAGIGVKSLDNTYSAMGPLIGAGLEEIDAFARTIRRGYLVTSGDKHFHQQIRFADKELLDIFNFEYIHGDSSALTDPKGFVVTRTIAMKIFGSLDIVGETVFLNHDHDLRITAVIEDLPNNSHFNSSLISEPVEILVPLVALNRIDGWNLEGNWTNISSGNHVYIMTKQPMVLDDLNQKINTIYDNHVDPEMKDEFMSSIRAVPLKSTHSSFWDMVGMPVLESIQILGILVLIVAIVNYTNLATAQSLGRTREVGLRKTLGASRKQLIAQFLTESLTIAFVAMILALVFLELVIPSFNEATSKSVSLDYLGIVPWLFSTTFVVGLVAGAYPSFLITRTTPIEALTNLKTKTGKGNLFRSIMIGTQFLLAIFMLAVVLIVYFQNAKVRESSEIFPKDEVLVLKRTAVESIREREDTLRNELLQLSDVTHVTFTAQTPFEQSNNHRSVSLAKGDKDNEFSTNLNLVDHDFIKTFDVPLLAGRDFSREISADAMPATDAESANVIVNQLLVKNLGYSDVNEAVGTVFWSDRGEDESALEYRIVGVMEDQNLLGLHNKIKPWIFVNSPEPHRYGAVRIRQGASASVISEVEEVWKRVIPDYPIEHDFLDGLFNDIYAIYKIMNGVLAGFAALALLLALIGLFGLAAFMARSRTKEIGVRIVLGASVQQIIRLLLWQFSKPVMWAVLFALPMAYFAANLYLQFFAERISFQVPIIILSGIIAIALACLIIAVHAIKVATTNPVKALRYE